jgi:hypothetical protein
VGLAVHPFFVGAGDVDGAVEGGGPVGPGSVEMRVGDDDEFEAAEGVDLADGVAVEVGDEVPEDVAIGGLD